MDGTIKNLKKSATERIYNQYEDRFVESWGHDPCTHLPSNDSSHQWVHGEFLFTHAPTALMACQNHRDYYRGFPKAYHPLLYFKEPQYLWQCGPDMSTTYLSYPPYHVGYKHPAVLPVVPAAIPPLPERSLAPRYNKAADKLFVR